MSRKFLLRKIFGNRSFLNYDPARFWFDRGKDYIDEEDYEFRGELVDDLTKFVEGNQIKGLFEIGVGYGLNLKPLMERLPNVDFSGCDISSTQLDSAKSFLGENFERASLFKHDLRDPLPFKDGYWDCVFSSGVLIHIMPENIEFVVSEMKRVAKRFVFLFEQDKRAEFGSRHPNNFVFFHDFRALFSDWRLVSCKAWDLDYFSFVFKKKTR